MSSLCEMFVDEIDNGGQRWDFGTVMEIATTIMIKNNEDDEYNNDDDDDDDNDDDTYCIQDLPRLAVGALSKAPGGKMHSCL